MISGLAKVGNITDACSLFERFKANGGIPDAASFNALIEGMSHANRAIEAYQVFEETRLRGCRINVKACISLLDALNKAECLEQAAVVGAVLREIAKSQHASRSL
jgi:pentatricopeptide repeat protein